VTTRNLDALFTPRAIVLIGASNEPGSVGNVAARNLFAGGFAGPIMPVNPHESEILSAPNYRSLKDLPHRPDLAVIATPARTVPKLIGDLCKMGCRAAVVISAGFDRQLRDEMLMAGRSHLMRIVGPNCLGFLSPVRGINASFTHKAPLKGRLAFVTQSGAIATSIIDWAIGRNIGFSHLISLGDMSDVDFGDLLDYLARDPETQAILLYAETVTQARKFMSAGRIAARAKPVIVVKGGRSKAGAKAAASHTGALAGADAVYDAVFRRAGMLRVDSLRELFDAAETLASGVKVQGDRLIILTNGGGLGVLAADALESTGGRLAELPAGVREQLDKVLPTAWSHGNPIDVLGDAQGDRYERALEILAGQTESDGLLVMNCPTGVADSMDAARATVKAKERWPRLPIIGCWMGAASTAEPREMLSRAGIPNCETPDEAVTAFLHLAEYNRNQKALFETPALEAPSAPARRSEARSIIANVVKEGRDTLTEPEAKAVLRAYNIPVAATLVVKTPQEAGAAADEIGGSVALKILSRQITHKTDVGGVRLDLSGVNTVASAAQEMLARVKAVRPDAVVDGLTVQQMVKRPHGQELLLGAVVDPTFGPCLLFGHGGVATEVIGDRAMGLPPLNRNLAMDMIGRTQVARLLKGYRDRPPAKMETIAAALVSLSDLMVDCPEIAELDINPLLADADGVIALDARIIVRPADGARPSLSIRPYPGELARELDVDGISMRLRPIRPEDTLKLVELGERADPKDLRFRLHGGVGVSPSAAARLSQIDYDREMVFLAEMPDRSIGGVVRLVFDPNFEAAECAIIVRTDLQRRGIGRTLLSEALAYARSRGAARIWGDVLSENSGALNLARRMGAKLGFSDAEQSLTRVEIPLSA
jgi:acetyltransferase